MHIDFTKVSTEELVAELILRINAVSSALADAEMDNTRLRSLLAEYQQRDGFRLTH